MAGITLHFHSQTENSKHASSGAELSLTHIVGNEQLLRRGLGISLHPSWEREKTEKIHFE